MWAANDWIRVGTSELELPGTRTVYICLCNGITDDHIADAVEEGASSLSDLQSRLGVATCCGRCAECAQSLLEERLAGASSRCPLQFC
jgi:bacterioferritin-associated ferredoxin